MPTWNRPAAALLLAALLCAATGGARGQAAPPAVMSAFASQMNQDIIINADLFSHKPLMMSGGLGFTNIVGVTDSDLNETVVRAAGGAWNTGLTCSNGGTPPARVITRQGRGACEGASVTSNWALGYNCTSDKYSGVPVCFSWPILPSSISKESFLLHLSDGNKLAPPCVGISPNFEFNERQCVVLFGPFGNRAPSTQGGLYPTRVEVVRGASLKLVGPRGPVSAAGLYATNTQSPYDGPTTGPVFLAAKLNVLSDVGEGISVPGWTNQAAFPNGGIALFGPYRGSLGRHGQRYRLRLFFSGGMTPDGVRSMQPGFFSRYFYLLAESGRGWYGYGRPQMVKVTRAGVKYDLGKRIGSIMVVGLADTGKRQNTTAGVIYDDCYQEDWDNYLDIIVDASGPKAALALKQVRAYYTSEGYDSVYNPGGPGMAPTPGVPYSTLAPPQTVRITHTLWNPMQVTWCQYNGTFTRDPHACSKLVGLT